ncbi:Rid family detoxifying hydrolase [Halopelagius fulvigenes]|uniref:Rid family detoxifying hydrolase n=1 Tax=Halopelagius fulvigenes TaxID=1198324 RepID=A0ABD5TSD1_9EURY
MPEKTAVSASGAPQNDNPYSQGVLADGLLFVSGFGPVDPETGEEVEGDVREQTHRVMENLAAVVEEAGGSLDDVVKATVYVTDMDDYGAVNEAYAEHVGETPPARVCIEASRLPDDVRVEIDAVAKVE